MLSPTGLVIGLMSGTSGDGVDAALVELTGVEPGALTVNIRAYFTVPYTDEFRERILRLCAVNSARVDEICRCNVLLGEAFADAVFRVCETAGVEPEKIDLVGSHGQTIHHLPPAGEQLGGTPSTLQIGEAAVIAERTGITTVANFRTRDMAAGGEGAPLVPFVDYVLFASRSETRAVQNIGGIGNVTALPAGGDSESVVAFDTGPGNMIIDALAAELLGQPADWNGAVAAQGVPHEGLLQQLLNHPYYRQLPPKSTGRELFGRQYAAQLHQKGKELGLSVSQLMATATALTARSIKDQYERFVVPQMGWPQRVILGGGGARNLTLVHMLRDLLPNTAVETHEQHGIPGDAKEAIAFAILAWRTWWLRSGNLPSATGAKRAVVLGSITPGTRNLGWWQNTL